METYDKRQGLGGILSEIFGGGASATTSSVDTASTTPTSAPASETTESTTSDTSASSTVTTSSSSSTTEVSTTFAQTTRTETSTRAPVTPTSSVSLVVSSVTSNGQVVPVTLTQTVVVVGPSGTSGAQNAGSGSGSKTNGALIGGVVGGVVGGLALLALAIALFVVLRRRKDRTGSAYILCFGRRPKYGEKADLNHSAGNWPTFDPSAGYAGSHGGGRGANGLPQATLPTVFADVDDVDDRGDPSHHHTSYDVTSRDGFSDAYSTTHAGDGSVARGNMWPSMPMGFAPDYSHLDDPETRRAREESAAAAAAAAATAPGVSPYSTYEAGAYQQGTRPHTAESTLRQSPSSKDQYGGDLQAPSMEQGPMETEGFQTSETYHTYPSQTLHLTNPHQ